jgi:hypothetical protein
MVVRVLTREPNDVFQSICYLIDFTMRVWTEFFEITPVFLRHQKGFEPVATNS